MNSIQIQCFLTAAQTLNFTKTAQLLYIAQPTVTHHISNLENEMGIQLFTRTKKQVFLTPAGEKLYFSMKKIFSEFNEAVLYAKKYEEEINGRVCLGCGSSELEKEFLPLVIRRFRKKYPQIHMTYNSSKIREKIKQLQQHDIDILLSTTQMINGSSTIEYYSLMEHPIVCVVNRENPLSRLEQVTIKDLYNQNLIFLDSTVSPPEIEELQSQIYMHYPHNVTHYVNDTDISHLIILSNMGIAVMPEFKYQEHRNLMAIPYIDYPSISYGIAKQKNDAREFVNSFIKITQAVIKEMY